MKLNKIRYLQHEGDPREWRLEEFELNDINLLVGKNASGKTRTLAIINTLAKLVCGERKPLQASGNYHVEFEGDDDNYFYSLLYKDQKVVSEELKRGEKILLKRGVGGEGEIFYTERADKGELDKFQSPDSEVAVFARRDSIQHGYFEPLYKWGKYLCIYYFGTPMGKDILAKNIIDENIKTDFFPKDANLVVEVLRTGNNEYGKNFIANILEDFKKIEYPAESISLSPPSSISFRFPSPSDEYVYISVKEQDLAAPTEQHDMSQGMFRALSIIIHLNYLVMGNHPSAILIDDVGEGLDFERSCALIELLMEKVKGTNIQLIMSTNDRFVMNKVPLEYWHLISRKGAICKIYNYKNSQEKFDDFKFTGLNNFDFFATDFINGEES